MRTEEKESKRYSTVHTLSQVPGTTDGSGSFSDGTSWKSVRTAVGQYDIMFDARLIPMNAVAGYSEAVRQYLIFTVLSPGLIHVRIILHDGTQNDSSFDMMVNWLDTRV